MHRTCRVGSFAIGPSEQLAVIAGPCVLESEQLGVEIAGILKKTCADLGFSYVFKASFDKANRTSIDSPRGPGLERGLSWMNSIKKAFDVPATTDVHEAWQCAPVAEVADVLQIPAFLCRQTDLLTAAGKAAGQRHGAVNIKKGQFLSPDEMRGPIEKVQAAGCDNILVTERGTFFGYGRLVNDFLGIAELMSLESKGGSPPICFDCTHSTQRPGKGDGGRVTGGAPPGTSALLARSATAAGVHALFLECHPEPAKALSDAATMMRLADVPSMLQSVARIRSALRP